MGRIRLAILIFASLGLLWCVSEQATAQSSNRPVRPNEEKGRLNSDARLGARRPLPLPRAPETFYCETPDTSCRPTHDTFPIAELRVLFAFAVISVVSVPACK